MLVELGKANTMVKNRYGLIPIMAAAERCQTAVFDYLFSQCSDVLTKEEEIDSLELLGASFANDKDSLEDTNIIHREYLQNYAGHRHYTVR